MKTIQRIDWAKLAEDHKYYNMCLIAHEDHKYYNMCLIAHLQQLIKEGKSLDALDIIAHCSKCLHHKASKQSAAINCVKPFCEKYRDVNCEYKIRNPYNSAAY
jgi:hypothetical protein